MRLLFIGVLFLSLTALGQRLQTPTLSPFSKTTQQVGLTEIGLEYARPSAKGRTVFGKLVPFNKIWRTGANASTKIILNEALKIGGNAIEKGTYALYTIPNKDNWTIIIHSNTDMRSIAGNVYKPEFDLFRFEVKSIQNNNYVETFTLQFTNVKTNTLNLQLSWENTIINIPFEVDVTSKIESQIKKIMTDGEPIPHRISFEIAQYYLNNDEDINTTLKHINSALKKSSKNFRYALLKAKILYKKGDLKAAIQTVTEANNWANDAKNTNYMEQTTIYKKMLFSKNE